MNDHRASGPTAAANPIKVLVGKKILFVVPRFHTNLFYATRSLINAGAHLALFATTTSSGEDHSIIQPTTFGHHPDREQVKLQLDDFSPDLIILRQSGLLSTCVWHWAKKARVRTVFYNLKPITSRRSLWRLAYLAIVGRPLERTTPCRGLNWGAANDRLAHYLPWPVGRYGSNTQSLSPRIHRKPLRILCVGKLAHPRKNQHHLVQAIKDSGLEAAVRLTLVGSAPPHEEAIRSEHYTILQAFAQENWINLLESQPFGKMAELYKEHDVCVLPSHNEPLGISPIEAMAYGAVPVISTECGSAGYIRDGVNGLLVDMGSPPSLSYALGCLVEDGQLLTRLSENALATAASELSERMFVQRVGRLLQGHRLKPNDPLYMEAPD